MLCTFNQHSFTLMLFFLCVLPLCLCFTLFFRTNQMQGEQRSVTWGALDAGHVMYPADRPLPDHPQPHPHPPPFRANNFQVLFSHIHCHFCKNRRLSFEKQVLVPRLSLVELFLCFCLQAVNPSSLRHQET